jgi:hypothetical protein
MIGQRTRSTGRTMARSGNKNRSTKRKPKPGDPIRMPTWWFFSLCLIAVAGAFWFFRQGDPVLAVAVPLIAISGWLGFRLGLAGMLISAVAFGLAIYFAVPLGMRLEDSLAQNLGTTGLQSRVVAVLIAAVSISMIASLLMHLVTGAVLRKRRKLRWTNQLTGFGIGLISGSAGVFLFLAGMISIQTWQRVDDGFVAEDSENSVARDIDAVASKTRQSAIGPLVRDHNPFEQNRALAELRDLRQSVRRLSQPDQVDKLLEDERLQALREDPDFTAALNELKQDAEFREFLNQKRPMDPSLLIQLLGKDSLKRLMDHPGFKEAAMEILQETS